MPRRSKGAHLWLRSAQRDSDGRVVSQATWYIKDGTIRISTGCGAEDRAAAEKQLADYIAAKYTPARRERDIADISVADVLAIYASDVVPDHARPEQTAARIERLIQYFGRYTLADINSILCRKYVADRQGAGRSKKGKGGGAKRDLEDLRAAIKHHLKAGLHRSVVSVTLPPRGSGRTRWLTRQETAKLLWACWRYQTEPWHRDCRILRQSDPKVWTFKRLAKRFEKSEGTIAHALRSTSYPLRHLTRLILIGVYTGSRPGACLAASWDDGPGKAFMDLEHGVFHRHGEGEVENNKRETTVRLSPRLLAHLKRWRRMDQGEGFVVSYRGARLNSVKVGLAHAVDLAGIQPMTAYTLRHTAASWLVQKGVNTRNVADYLGTSEKMILDHYGHLAPDFQVGVAELIGKR